MRDTTFYNQESAHYSQRRYASVAASYLQFFYGRRLAITKRYIHKALPNIPAHPALLEVGCADGVVVRAIEKDFPNTFSELVGIDIAPSMIAEARRKATDPHTKFFVRNEYPQNQVDLIVETGVINYSTVDQELAFAHQNLQSEGRFILSIAGTGSLYNRLKHDGGLNDFRSYRVYDRLIREKFLVEQVEGVGFFIPYLWRVPALARVVQSIVEPSIATLLPGWCHEKMYLLKKK